MKAGGLFTAIGVLVVLGGLVWWSSKNPPADPKNDAKTAAAATPKVIAADPKDITGITIAKAGAEPIVMTKVSDQWEIVKPSPLHADQDAAGMLASSLATLNGDRLIDEHPSSLTEFGLTTPQLEIDLALKGKPAQKLLIGGDTPTGNGNYAKLEDSPRVFTLPTYTKTSFDKSLTDLRDKRLLTFNSDKVTAVSVTTKGPAFEFGKNAQGDWQITKPKPLRADTLVVDDFVRKLKDARMDLSADFDPKAAAAQFAGGARTGVAIVTDNGAPQTLEVRKGKDNNYYAKSSVGEGFYKVASDLGAGLDKSLDDFRNKKLFDFGFNDPSKLEINGTAYTKAGDKWTSATGQFDAGTVQTLIDRLRDVSATKLADKAPGTPLLTIAVTSGDAHKFEKVVINKDGESYSAVRDGETTVYILEAKSVEEVQQGVSGIRPYVQPKATEKKK